MVSSALPTGLEDFDVRTEGELPSLVSVRRFKRTIEDEKSPIELPPVTELQPYVSNLFDR
jgi:hypothetical protein